MSGHDSRAGRLRWVVEKRRPAFLSGALRKNETVAYLHFVTAPDSEKIKCKALDDSASLDRSCCNNRDRDTRCIDVRFFCIGIDEPAQLRAILDPSVHLLLGLHKTVRSRQQLDDKVRTKMRKSGKLSLSQTLQCLW
jgi:hypothetical protein